MFPHGFELVGHELGSRGRLAHSLELALLAARTRW
jgi:hypothetical protein